MITQLLGVLKMISVIVPIYNTESYLPRCIDSIIKQSYQDFELLLIDDGSTDSSGDICDSYANSDDRIRVFHKNNGGQADARNYGLDRIKGDYITFIDSDDYIGIDYLKILMDAINKYQVDLAISAWSIVRTNELIFVDVPFHSILLNREETFKEIIIGEKIWDVPWGKIYHKKLFESVRFPKVSIYEDSLTIPYVLDQCDNCIYCSSKQYYYFHRNGSVMNSSRSHQMNKIWMEASRKLCFYTKEVHPDLYQFSESKFIKDVFWEVIDWTLFNEDYAHYSKEIRNNNFEHFCKAFVLPNLTIKERLKACAFLLNVELYRRIRIAWLKILKNPDGQKFLNEDSKI